MGAWKAGNSLWFEGLRLDHNGLFRVSGVGGEAPVTLGSRALDLLRLLAERQGEIVSKDAIMEAVWPGQAVAESNLTVQISALRRALDRDGHSPIQNIPGRGYRFAAAVTRTDAATNGVPALALPDKPSIAVLPFQNLSGDPDQEYFADGMVEEIITALSRIRWLFVIARNSSFTYKGQAVDVKRVGRELGVRYLLEGSVRKAGGQIRITAQLIEAESEAHLWADHFDGSLEDVFQLQDQVASSVAGVIEPALQAAETARADRRPTGNLRAYDLYLRALPHLAARHKDGVLRALELLSGAIERDPNCGPALAEAAQCHFELDLNGWADNREANSREAIDLAKRALRAAPDDPDVLANVGFVLGFFGEDILSCMALADRALDVNPNCARGWYWAGVLRNWTGCPDVAVGYFENCLRLMPRGRFAYYLTGYGIALFFVRRFEDAATKLRESLASQPDYVLSYRFLAASFAHMGRIEEARVVIDQLRKVTSVILDNGTRYRNPEYREMYLSGLRLAAGETA